MDAYTLEYNSPMLGDLNWGGSSFTRSHNPTAVYMTFPSGVIQKFFLGFDNTLSTKYHEVN